VVPAKTSVATHTWAVTDRISAEPDRISAEPDRISVALRTRVEEPAMSVLAVRWVERAAYLRQAWSELARLVMLRAACKMTAA
jgi:hypothetical protein